LIAAKLLVAFLAVAVLVAAACSESTLPTETKLELQPHFATVMQGGCPAPFTLTIYVEADIDAAAADRNGDGFACYLLDQQDAMIFRTWTDNNLPLSQIGGCPNGFDIAQSGMTWMDTFDRNGDFLVCTRTTSNGSTIVIDNNNPNQKMM
jgi:hypothetical protein